MGKITAAVLSLLGAGILIFTGCEFDMYTYAKYGPRPDKVYIFFQDGPFQGDLGGRDGVDQQCRDKYDSTYSTLNAFMVKGFISVSSDDQIRDLLPSVYWDTPVYGIQNDFSETQISESWTALWDGTIDATFDSAIGIAADWWSGSDPDGTYNGVSCDSWTNSLSGLGQGGSRTSSLNDWISYASYSCSGTYNLLCVSY